MSQTLSVSDKVKIKAIANEWMSSNLNGEKRHLSSTTPEYDEQNDSWVVGFVAKHAQNKVCGNIHISADLAIVKCTKPTSVTRRLERLLAKFGTGSGKRLPPPPRKQEAYGSGTG